MQRCHGNRNYEKNGMTMCVVIMKDFETYGGVWTGISDFTEKVDGCG